VILIGRDDDSGRRHLSTGLIRRLWFESFRSEALFLRPRLNPYGADRQQTRQHTSQPLIPVTSHNQSSQSSTILTILSTPHNPSQVTPGNSPATAGSLYSRRQPAESAADDHQIRGFGKTTELGDTTLLFIQTILADNFDCRQLPGRFGRESRSASQRGRMAGELSAAVAN
jgi:hypothetical protein